MQPRVVLTHLLWTLFLLGLGWVTFNNLHRLNLRPAIYEATLLGTLQVGRGVPDFEVRSVEGKTVSALVPSAKFHIYLIDHDLPTACLNQGCSPNANQVVNRGGQLKGFSDPAIARLFGVNMVQDPELSGLLVSLEFGRFWYKLRGGSVWHFLYKLAVVADDKGVIQGIYQFASIKDLDWILARVPPTP